MSLCLDSRVSSAKTRDVPPSTIARIVASRFALYKRFAGTKERSQQLVRARGAPGSAGSSSSSVAAAVTVGSYEYGYCLTDGTSEVRSQLANRVPLAVRIPTWTCG